MNMVMPSIKVTLDNVESDVVQNCLLSINIQNANSGEEE
jgi:hypothetical protein